MGERDQPLGQGPTGAGVCVTMDSRGVAGHRTVVETSPGLKRRVSRGMSIRSGEPPDLPPVGLKPLPITLETVVLHPPGLLQ
jgi:hypothetical protein